MVLMIAIRLMMIARKCECVVGGVCGSPSGSPPPHPINSTQDLLYSQVSIT